MKKKILFVNDEMITGGVSKVLINLLWNLDSAKYDITLLVLHLHGDMLKEVPPYVKIVAGSAFFSDVDVPVSECMSLVRFVRKVEFYLLQKTGLIKYRMRYERKKMNLPAFDVEVAFKEGVCTLFCASGFSKKKINWVHTDYKVMNYVASYTNTMKKMLKCFDHIVAVSERTAESFKEVFDLNEVFSIHNLMNEEEILNKCKDYVPYKKEEFTFICVGRLDPAKSYDRLLYAVDELNRMGYIFTVYIVGDGQLKEELFSLKNKLDIHNVHFCGNQQNPYPWIANADCLLLTSIFEGLPTVVFESLILHVPVISTFVGGIREQLNSKHGMIVENSLVGIISGMKDVLDNPEYLNYWKDQLVDYHYDNHKIIQQIEELFN